ncbi:hypothetical protein FGO68_gene18 [Halteria grandinella]|uniref:Uncharacterized protein n=1 Tax=Halteria grandinella TaxID=5974 RepID=A0A8J8P6S0_HALGN|nr:hypothetical protein FGO68_gene18 [Halteria grandinella]
MIVMDITNGDVVTATQFSATNYDCNRRNLLLLDDGSIILGDNTRIVKVTPPQTNAPTNTLSGYETIGLQTNTAQSYLHVFAYASSFCIITAMDMASFTRVYQYLAQCASASADDLAQTFQSCIHQTSSTVDTIIFQEGTRFFRIHNQYSPPTFTTSSVHDTNTLNGKGLHCVSNDLVYSLMHGTYSPDSNRIFVAEVNFNTNKITYRRYLQSITSSVFHGVIYAADKFFLVGFSQSIQRTSSSSFNTRASKTNGVIYSPLFSCQSVNRFSHPQITLTANTYTLTATTNTYTSSSITVNDLSSSLPSRSNIVSTEFEGQYVGSCSLQLPVAPHDYTALSSTQTTSAFTYAIESMSVTIPITQFNATKVSSAPDPVYTYSLDSYYQHPNGVTVSAATGDIVISSPSTIGAVTYTVVIEGKLQDCQTI